MSKLTKKEIGAHIALLVAAMFWGTTFVAISSTSDYFPPAFLVFTRCAIGVTVLILVFIKRLKNLSRSYFTVCAFLGFLMTIGYLMQNFSIAAGCPPGRCGFLVATYCVITPFIAWFVWKRKPNIYHVVAAVLCLVGIGFISMPDLLKDSIVGLNLGDFLALIGSVVFAAYLVYLGRYVDTMDPILLTIGNLFFGAVYAGLYTYFFEDSAKIVWNGHSVFAALYLGVVCMSLTNILQAIGQREVVASTAALIFSLESVFGIILAVLFWHEKVTVSLFIGCVLIFIAIVISETKLGFLKKKLSSNVFRKIFSQIKE
ncbi:DMT family transporter [Treponema vincentii]|uniref:DMT family transporter n=1 Tax=Treponema vincentii TaxID=69710 RepID=UPI003D929600